MDSPIHTKECNLNSHSLNVCNACIRSQTYYGDGWPNTWGLGEVGVLMSVTRNRGPKFNTKVISLASQRSCGVSSGGFRGMWALDVPRWRPGIALLRKS